MRLEVGREVAALRHEKYRQQEQQAWNSRHGTAGRGRAEQQQQSARARSGSQAKHRHAKSSIEGGPEGAGGMWTGIPRTSVYSATSISRLIRNYQLNLRIGYHL